MCQLYKNSKMRERSHQVSQTSEGESSETEQNSNDHEENSKMHERHDQQSQTDDEHLHLGPKSSAIHCPMCDQQTTTKVIYQTSDRTHMKATLLTLGCV